MKLISTLTFLSLFFFSITAKSQIVISQVYGGGGATSGTPAYHDDYIELHNQGAAPVQLYTITAPNDTLQWSIQYGSQAGNFGPNNSARILLPKNLIIPAGGYYLIQILSADSATVSSTRVPIIGAPLPVAADLVVGKPGTPGTTVPPYVATVAGNPALSGTNGKIVLLSDTTLLFCGQTSGTPKPCTVWPPVSYKDMVGYGKVPKSVSNCEGCSATDSTGSVLGGTSSLNSGVVAVRKNNGNQDTQNNSADFDTIPNALPRNSVSPIVVPVKLSAFNVLKNNNTVKIYWTTEQELNASFYIIERSSNGINQWGTVATVKAIGNTSVVSNYSYTDQAPVDGLNFYRLRQVDVNGKYDYSSIKKAFFDIKFKALVSPNPAKDFINVYISKNNSSASTVLVNDLNGKRIRSTTTNDTDVKLNIRGLTKGVYVVKVINNNNVTTQKVFVQ